MPAARAADGAGFDSYTQGRTLFFTWQGQPYGAEQYLPGRRVIWSFLDGDCIEGHWYPQDGAEGPEICFVYDGRDDAQCWSYAIDETGLRVTIEGDGSPLTLTERREAPQEMVCLGPEVGV